MKKAATLLVLFLSLSGFFSCSSLLRNLTDSKDSFRFQKVSESDWPEGEEDLDRESLFQALEESLTYLKTQAPERSLPFGSGRIQVQDLVESLRLFQGLLKEVQDPAAFRREVKKRFHLFRLEDPDTPYPLLLTGYYEPILNGSRRPSDRYRYPVYRLPDDLLIVELDRFSSKYAGQRLVARLENRRVIPYFSRQEIDQEGALAGKNWEILWVDDPLKLFFLHIQGSGRVRLEDGSWVRLGYHGTNGRPYVPIGRELIRRGAIQKEELSLPSIYTYLKNRPEEQAEILNLNPSYVFFREVEGGPYGNLGRPLTAGRSVAADQRIYPPAALAWLKGWKPILDEERKIRYWVPFGRWVFIQDSGGAITGPSRIDLFTGYGEEAEITAGHLRHPGAIWLLLKKEIHPGS